VKTDTSTGCPAKLQVLQPALPPPHEPKISIWKQISIHQYIPRPFNLLISERPDIHTAIMAPVSKVASAIAVLMLAASGLAAPTGQDRRQIGGEATALYEVVNNVDNASGYATENFLDGVDNGIKPGSGGNEEYGQQLDGNGSSPPPPSKRHVRRQGNKIANAAGPLIEDLGQQQIGEAVQTTGNQEDGTLTAGVGDLGTTTGEIEEGTLSEAGYGAGQIAGSVIQQAKGGAPVGGAAPQ
jgi:hypothetical protein